MKLNTLYNTDCIEFMKSLDNASIDCILTDPPYQYLNHKLDIEFNADDFFEQAYRVLKKDSFLCFFGRGTAFYKWNVICSELGFKFKEEIIWDKKVISSPVTPIGRRHETIAVYNKGNKKLNPVFINKLEICDNVKILKNDLIRLVTKLKKFKTIEELREFLKGKYIKQKSLKFKITLDTSIKSKDRAFGTIESYSKGYKFPSILPVSRENYSYQHPTQKPLQLMKYLVKLITSEDEIILDPFMGSGTTCLAAYELGRKYIGIDINKEYVEIAKKRLSQKRLF